MASVIDIFSKTDNSEKLIDPANAYKKDKEKLDLLSPSLSQGDQYKKYQKRIKKKLEKKIEYVNSPEGFVSGSREETEDVFYQPDTINNVLTNSSNDVLRNTNMESKEAIIKQLQTTYDATLAEYQTLLATLSGNTSKYLDRVNPNNPYLNQTIRFSTGHICYVTGQGVVKFIPSMEIWDSVKAPKNYIDVNIPWNNEWNNNEGAIIPTTPQLIAGTFMVKGQSLGAEGQSIYVNKFVTNSETEKRQCHINNNSMTFIGGEPPKSSSNIVNGNFTQPAIGNNSYQYITSNSAVPGWEFAAVIVNNSGAWGYSMPYPNGSQCLSIQTTQSVAQTLYLNAGEYTLSFIAIGRPCCDGAGASNPVNISLNGSVFFTVQPPINKWTNYTKNFSVSTTGNNRILFKGTWGSSDRSTAFQSIQVSAGGGSNINAGTYTYDMCKNAAMQGGNEYFGLANVNTETNKGYCAVTNNVVGISQSGTSYAITGAVALWASNTNGQTGNSAVLRNTGLLLVINSSGQSTSTSSGENANPPNYLGCYNDCYGGRALPTYTGNNKNYDDCSKIAKDGNWSFFGLQYTQPNGRSECWVGNDQAKALSQGKAGNCTKQSNIVVGGGCSNAVYYYTAAASNYFLTLQDDGNMCIYRGTGPSDNQGYIWCTMTNGRQQKPNPKFAAAKGKYGKNWMSVGSTLAAGDFLGSTDGSIYLIMQTDGNLVLYTSTQGLNCPTMKDGNVGGGEGAIQLMRLKEVGVPANMGKLSYIDQNSTLYNFRNSEIGLGNSYNMVIENNNTWGNDIPGAAYDGATIDQCKSSCNGRTDCYGFVYQKNNRRCWPKNKAMWPFGGPLGNDVNTDTYVRDKSLKSLPPGVTKNIINVDSLQYSRYQNSNQFIGSEYGLANATSTQKQQLDNLKSRLNMLSNQIIDLTGKFNKGTNSINTQSNANVKGLDGYVVDLKDTREQIRDFDLTNVDNILTDSDIIVLEQNYKYLFWTILTTGVVLISMNIAKK